MRIDTQILKAVIRRVGAIADPRASREVLGCVHLVPAGGALVVRATDLNAWAEAEILCPGVAAGEAVGVSAAELARVLAAAEADQVEIEIRDDGRVRVASGVDALFSAVGEFELPDPPAAPAETAEADLGGLARAVERVRHAVSRDETRPVLRCLHLAPLDGGVVVEATDGHRAAWCRAEGGLPGELLLPGEALARALPEGHGIVGLDGSWLYLYREDCPVRWRWWLRRMEGTFPNLGSVMPKPKVRIRIQGETWAARLKHLGRMGLEGMVKMICAGGVVTAAAGTGGTEATVSAPVETEALTPDAEQSITWAWRGDYAADALEAAGPGQVDLLLADPLSPIVIRSAREGDGWGGLVMPVRLG